MAYLGYDIQDYPGDTAVQNLWTGTPFWWVGFYLGGICYSGDKKPSSNQSASYTAAAYTKLKQIGYGVAPLYVGHQPTCSTPTDANAQQLGESDAAEAASFAQDVGFPSGTHIFLDIEGGDALSSAMLTYAKAWISYINSTKTSYWAAVYAGPAVIQQLRNNGFTGRTMEARWYCDNFVCPDSATTCRTSSCQNIPSDPAPCNPSWTPDADAGMTAQQYAGNVSVKYNGTCLDVDLDTSPYSDPARPVL